MDTVNNDQNYDQGYDHGYDQPVNQDWRSNISPELQNTASRFNSPESLVKAYRDAQGLIGKKVGEYSQQDWQSYAAIQEQINNIPSSSDRYNFDLSPLSEDSENTFSNEDIAALKEVSHALGLNSDQAQGLYNVLNEVNNQAAASQEEASMEYASYNLSELARDWGEAYETKLQSISNCVENILPQITGVSAERIKEEISQSGMQYSSLLMNMFAAIGELGSEGRSSGYNNIAPMDANMRLEHLKSDPNFANIMANRWDPRHNQVKEEYRSLLAIKNGEM